MPSFPKVKLESCILLVLAVPQAVLNVNRTSSSSSSSIETWIETWIETQWATPDCHIMVTGILTVAKQ